MITSVAHPAPVSLRVTFYFLAVLLILPNSVSAFQEGSGRVTVPSPPKEGKATASGGKTDRGRSTGGSKGGSVIKPPRLADMKILAPNGSRIWIDDVEINNSKPTFLLNQQKVRAIYSADGGLITLKGLKPGSYRIAARKQDFREYMNVADVLFDQENVVSIVLTPLPAKLTVSPSIGGSEVEVLNLDSGKSMGHFFHNLDQVEIAPGRYRVTTSKNGYRVSMREVTARAGESIYLEPLLEPLPTPTPTPPPTINRRNIPMTLETQRQDKFLILRLQGSSGEVARTVGSINVTLGGPASNYVTGNLNGLPCRVEFIKLENIGEGSIVEAPGPSNNWSTVVVRIRAKDEKRRPISFAINWNSLAQSSSPFSSPTPNTFVAAVAIQRVQPNFPPEARGSAINGTVLVSVAIDDTGSVISAKAIEGPFVFRRVSEDAARKWKFTPATRDGRNVESDQIIQFKFQRSAN